MAMKTFHTASLADQVFEKLENDGYLTMYDLKVIFQVKSF